MNTILDRDRTLSLFSLFSDLEGEALTRWRSRCDAATAYIEARLRPEADPADDMEALCAAAAARAYCDYLLLGSAAVGNASELRVGDVSVKESSTTADVRRDAEAIRDHFLAAAAHLLRPGCPALLAVEEPA